MCVIFCPFPLAIRWTTEILEFIYCMALHQPFGVWQKILWRLPEHSRRSTACSNRQKYSKLVGWASGGTCKLLTRNNRKLLVQRCSDKSSCRTKQIGSAESWIWPSFYWSVMKKMFSWRKNSRKSIMKYFLWSKRQSILSSKIYKTETEWPKCGRLWNWFQQRIWKFVGECAIIKTI